MFDEDQLALRDLLRQIGRDRIRDAAGRWDREHEFPWEIHELLAAQGLYGLMIPQEYGGLGRGVVDFALMLETIGAASACGATMGALETSSLGAQPILLAGDEEQKKRWLPEVASGEALCAFSITEAETGSDASSLAATAVRDGDSYRIRAHKVFCTLGSLARYITVFAKTDKDAGVRGISAFVVDTRDAPGFSVGRVEQKMGLRGNPTVELFFDDVVVPAENRLGEEGGGFAIAMQTLAKGRVAVSADSVGVMQFCLDYAAAYAQDRKQFGRPLSDLQAIQFKLADMAIRHETARQATYHAARVLDDPNASRNEVAHATAVAKAYSTDVRMEVVSEAIQVLGGYGYMEDHPLERIFRDSKIYQIFEGTNEIQRVIIGRGVAATAGGAR
jgi:alkylation response protein AidB-like acyl-CoA dehydrogenase